MLPPLPLRKLKTDYRIDDHAVELVEWYREHDELWC